MSAEVEKFIRFCDSEFGKKIVKKEAEHVYNELRKCQVILDVGCGIGSFEQNLPGLNIVGLDISKEMLEEARKRSNGVLILGSAECLAFKDSVFDAAFIVTALEFLDDYQKAVEEIARVTEKCAKILAMMLNPESEYFKEEIKKPSDYFRRIRGTSLKEIRDCISQFYTVSKEEYFLGIRRQQAFDTNDKRYASLYMVFGTKPTT